MLLLAALLVPSAAVRARSAPGPVRPSRKYAATIARWDSLVFKESRDSAWHWLDAVEAAAPRDSGLRVVSGAQRALLLMMSGQYDAARRAASPALAAARATRDTLLECRVLYVTVMSGALENRPADVAADAARLGRLAAAGRSRLDRAQARLALAYLDLLRGRPAAAERGYRAALRDYSPTLHPLPRRIARIGLARACFQQGRHDEARRVDIEAVREARAAGDPVNEAFALNNLAVHELTAGDPSDAVACLRRAFELQLANQRRERFTTGANLAGALALLGRNEEAAAVLDSLLAALAPAATAARADLLVQYALVRARQGRMESSDALADRAWALAESAAVRPDRDLVVLRAQQLARAGRIADAVTLLDRGGAARPAGWTDEDDALAGAAAAEILCDAGRAADGAARWRRVIARVDTSGAVGKRMRAHAHLGEARALLQLGDVDAARRALADALPPWRDAHAGTRSAEWRLGAATSTPEGWGEGALALLRPWPGERAAERVRAAFDFLQEVQAPADARAGLAAELQRRALRPGELVLQCAPAGDSLLVLALARDAERARLLPDRRALERRIERLAELARDRTDAAGPLRAEAARALAAVLLEPFADLLGAHPVLLVGGGGVLDALPWALLPAPGRDRALFETHGVALVPSFAALAAARTRPLAPAVRGPLVLAGGTGEDGRPLRGVEGEVAWLRGRYAHADVRRPRDDAGRRAALAALASTGVVHVAAHFTDDPENPWRSGVLLGDPGRDGSWLRVSELARVRTRARLAVLAGCTSAGAHGRSLQGERGLASAFLAAGAPAVVGTLWPVGDVASAEFVKRFYTALDGGADAGRALAEAQAALRAAPGTTAGTWAAFVLLGDPGVRISLPRRRLPLLPALLPAGAIGR